MTEKRITWISETKAEIEILDGQAKGLYQIDIESYENIPCAGLITIGQIGKMTIKVRIEDIPEYKERYARTPRALKARRQYLCAAIAGALDERQQLREWAQETGVMDDLPMPEYDSPKYRQAKRELVQFDAEHPEIIAEIKREKEVKVERHLWD